MGKFLWSSRRNVSSLTCYLKLKVSRQSVRNTANKQEKADFAPTGVHPWPWRDVRRVEHKIQQRQCYVGDVEIN